MGVLRFERLTYRPRTGKRPVPVGCGMWREIKDYVPPAGIFPNQRGRVLRKMGGNSGIKRDSRPNSRAGFIVAMDGASARAYQSRNKRQKDMER
ncbi:hypothetical protein DD557_08870 [Thalassobacter stenotrophicus]|nr:hypothetical protein DD557_08870 [Thalassobacter stenotrophicus]